MMHCVYVLQSELRPSKVYVGRTIDMNRRVDYDNSGRNPETARFRPWRLLVCCCFLDEELSRGFAGYLKTRSGRGFLRRHLAGYEDSIRAGEQSFTSRKLELQQ